MARDMGVRTPLADHETLAMGTRELTLLDNALGYATVARGGVPMEPVLVRSVVNWHGEPVALPSRPTPSRVLSPEVAAELDQALREVVRSGTARAAWHPQRDRAGKTGTSDGPSDAWFVGYTRDMVTGVWVGFDDPSKKTEHGGSKGALPIWTEHMRGVVRGLPVEFDRPPRR